MKQTCCHIVWLLWETILSLLSITPLVPWATWKRPECKHMAAAATIAGHRLYGHHWLPAPQPLGHSGHVILVICLRCCSSICWAVTSVMWPMIWMPYPWCIIALGLWWIMATGMFIGTLWLWSSCGPMERMCLFRTVSCLHMMRRLTFRRFQISQVSF